MTTEAQRVLQTEVASTGRDPEYYQAAVLADAGAETVVATLDHLPNLRAMLLLETSASRAIELRGVLGAHRERVPGLRWQVEPLREERQYASTAYLAMAKFLLIHAIGLNRAFVYNPPPTPQSPEGAKARQHALDDLLWYQSTLMIKLLQMNRSVPVEFGLRWASHLADSQQPLQALKFLYLIKNQVKTEAIAPSMFRCLLDLGCASELTLEWVERLPAPKSDRSATTRKIRQVMRSDRANARATLSNNLQVLAERVPEAVDAIRRRSPTGVNVGSLPDFPWLINLHSGVMSRANHPMFFRVTDNGVETLNLPHDPRKLLGTMSLAEYRASVPGVLVGSLLAIDDLINLVSNPLQPNLVNMEQPIYLVERNLDHAALALSTFDLRQVLSESRVRCYFGEDAVERLEQAFERNSRLLLPSIQISVQPDVRDVVRRSVEAKQNRFSENRARQRDRYPEDFPLHVADVLCGKASGPLRLLLVTSYFSTVIQYVTGDMEQAFSALGATPRVCKERSGIERCDTRVIAECIDDFHPHILMIIDHLRPEFRNLLPENLPWISWNQDPLPNLYCAEHIAKLGPNDFSYAVQAQWVDDFRRLGYPHIEHLPFAANSAVYRPVDDPPAAKDEVAYIMNMGPADGFFPAHPDLQARMVALYDRFGITHGDRRASVGLVREAFASLGKSVGEDELERLADFCARTFERWYDRRRVLRWLVEEKLPVGLYGHGWKRDPEFSHLARGWVSQGPELADLYRRSKVVLHVNNSLNAHQRVFECLAAGGFVLARRTPFDELPGELSSCLRIGEEIELFSSRETLVEKVRRAFADEPWRRSILRAGQRRVMAEHTYVARAQRILDDLRDNLKRRKARAA